ncbi:MAG TPA: uracil-DNA glycosylase [Thermoplasmata archaeon]|jgi:DNA polymerase
MKCGRIDLACTKCRLSHGRTKVVPGDGPCDSEILFVGEAPGRDEDLSGRPFVGRGGKLLEEALDDAGVRRDQVRITNLVKCRPPGNRRPRKDETAICTSLYLMSEIESVKPRVICALGQTSAEYLAGRKMQMGKVVGNEVPHSLPLEGVRLFVAYHPAACLYQRKNLKDFKKSIQAAVRAAGLAGRKRG